MVVGKPLSSTARSILGKMLASAPVVSHTVFDKQSFKAAFGPEFLSSLDWFDSTRMVCTLAAIQRSWIRLGDMSKFLELDLNHHDALFDAIACGKITIQAMNKTGKTIEEPVHE